MKLIAILIAVALPYAAFAGESGDVPKPVLEDLAKDLSQLHEAVLAAQKKQRAYEFLKAKSGPEKITVTSASATVRAGATEGAASLFKASKGDDFPVIDKAGGWYAVVLKEPVRGQYAGWVKAADAVPGFAAMGKAATAQTGTSLADEIFRELTERAAKFRQSYQNNPYISVTGFSVNVVPPSLSINFEFKK